MNSQDILNYSLAGGFLVLIATTVYLIYHVIKILRSVEHIMEDVEDTTKAVRVVKDGLSAGITALGTIFSKRPKKLIPLKARRYKR